MDYDVSKNSVEKTPTKKAESDQIGKMLMGRDGSMPGMSGGHAATVESNKVNHLKIIIPFCIFVMVGVMIAIIMVVLNGMRVDYAASYKIAKEMKTEVGAMRADDNCKKVMSNADLDYVKMETYMGYVEGCAGVTEKIDKLADQLSKTEGARQNGNIANAYNRFLDSFLVVKQGDEKLKKDLEYYQAWHEWILAQEKLEGWDASETDLNSATKVLTESDNAVLKKYGQEWLSLKKRANKAYRDFHYSDILADNRSALLTTMNNAQKDFADWVAKNAVDIKTLVALERADTTKVYTNFESLYSLIRENYEKNYHRGSHDCLETFTDIVCD